MAKRGARHEELDFPSWGGARRGAGRKPNGPRPGVAHRSRPSFASRHPVHVTLRLVDGLESLRRPGTHGIVRRALVAGAGRAGFRLVQFAVLSNHLHLICEARDAAALSRGVKGLCIRIARRLNRRWLRRGRVFADRYHTHVLRTPKEVLHALAYVLNNAHRHGLDVHGTDPCSSGMWFEDWSGSRAARRPEATSPLPRARTWLLTTGWKRHGPIPRPFDHVPRQHTRIADPELPQRTGRNCSSLNFPHR